MTEIEAWVLAVAGLAVAVRALVLMVRNRPVDDAQFYLMAAAELGLLIGAVAGFVALARTNDDVPAGLFVSYWVTTVCILPLGLGWGVSDKSRWGTGVVALSGLVVAALCARLLQIWVTGA